MHKDHHQDSISLGWGFYECAQSEALRDPKLDEVLAELLGEEQGAGFSVFGGASKAFPDEDGTPHMGGTSAVRIIGESSADFHPWILKRLVHGATLHIRLFYCQFTGNNDEKAEEFKRLCIERFRPRVVVLLERKVFPVEFDEARIADLALEIEHIR